MNRKSSREVQEHDQVAQVRPPTLTEDNRLAPDSGDRGAGPRVDGSGEGGQPSDAAVRTGDNGGGTSGNHGNGTAG